MLRKLLHKKTSPTFFHRSSTRRLRNYRSPTNGEKKKILKTVIKFSLLPYRKILLVQLGEIQARLYLKLLFLRHVVVSIRFVPYSM